MGPLHRSADSEGPSPPARPRLAYRRPAPAATVEDVLALIDAARASLGPEDLAAVLTVVSRETELLRRGALPARPRGRLREGKPALSPAARECLRPIRSALAEVARAPVAGRPPDLVELGERVAAHAQRAAPPVPTEPPG